MGYKLETTALISKENYNTFRIRCIMLIVEKLYQSLIQLELSLTRKKPTKQYLIPNITGKTP